MNQGESDSQVGLAIFERLYHIAVFACALLQFHEGIGDLLHTGVQQRREVFVDCGEDDVFVGIDQRLVEFEIKRVPLGDRLLVPSLETG